MGSSIRPRNRGKKSVPSVRIVCIANTTEEDIDWLCKSCVLAVAGVSNPDKEMVLSESQLALCTVFTLYLGEYLNALIG